MTVREKLIELLRVPIYPHELADPAEVVADYLLDNGLIFATDNNVGSKWIPVTERLPEDDLPKNSKAKQLKVLVAYKTNGRYVVRSAIRAKGYWHSKDGWAWIKMSDPITHWMPLPEPPKEGE